MANETILVIEDDQLNLKLCRSILELEGFKIITAMEAETGLKLLSKEQPDLILMDIQLPGIDGLKATEIIKLDPNLKDIPVVALTAHAMEGDDQKAFAAGCCGYITKPIEIKSFAGSLRQYLKRPALPPNPLKAAPSLQPSRSGSEPYQKKVLIVDDELLNRKLLTGMLAGEPYKLITAACGNEALSLIESQPPDIILLDIMMPDLDGIEVTKRLKSDAETQTIPIVLITALTDYQDKIKGLEAGADEFLNKPVQAEELLTRIHSLLRMKEDHDRLSSRMKLTATFKRLALPATKISQQKSGGLKRASTTILLSP